MSIKRKKVVTISIACIVIGLFVSVLGAVWFTGGEVFEGATLITSNESTAINRNSQMEGWGIDVEEFNGKYIIEEIEIVSSIGGHIIPGDYISKDGNKNKNTAILVHGLGGNRISTYSFAEIFLELGYNVLAYDQRNSGENTAKHNAFGYLESYDFIDYVDYVNNLIDKDKMLVAWGASYGGATIGTALGRDHGRIDRVILDCPLSNGKYILDHELEAINEKFGVPIGLMLFSANMTLERKLGFSFDDIDVSDWIKDTTVPVLIINSKVDAVTPYSMGLDIYNAILGENKKLVTVEDSKHIMILNDYPELYKEEVRDFFK